MKRTLSAAEKVEHWLWRQTPNAQITREPPTECSCEICGPSVVFRGSGAWEAKLYHVGRHYANYDPPGPFEDAGLIEWALKHKIVELRRPMEDVLTDSKVENLHNFPTTLEILEGQADDSNDSPSIIPRAPKPVSHQAFSPSCWYLDSLCKTAAHKHEITELRKLEPTEDVLTDKKIENVNPSARASKAKAMHNTSMKDRCKYKYRFTSYTFLSLSSGTIGPAMDDDTAYLRLPDLRL